MSGGHHWPQLARGGNSCSGARAAALRTRCAAARALCAAQGGGRRRRAADLPKEESRAAGGLCSGPCWIASPPSFRPLEASLERGFPLETTRGPAGTSAAPCRAVSAGSGRRGERNRGPETRRQAEGRRRCRNGQAKRSLSFFPSFFWGRKGDKAVVGCGQCAVGGGGTRRGRGRPSRRAGRCLESQGFGCRSPHKNREAVVIASAVANAACFSRAQG